MYTGAVAAAQLSSSSNEFTNILLQRDKDHLEWLENAMKVSCMDGYFTDECLVIQKRFARGIYCEHRERHHCMGSSFTE